MAEHSVQSLGTQGVIDYGKFRTSLERLNEQHENYRKSHVDLSDVTQEAIAESVVQRFETCYDCLWKVLRRYLFEALGIADPPNSPKPVLRLAHENHLLPSPVEKWLLYADNRNATSHDYDGEKAKACLDIVADFIGDAIGLYQIMSRESWD